MSTSPSIIKQDAEGENGKKEETANAEALDKAYKLQIVIPKSAIDSKLVGVRLKSCWGCNGS